VRDHDGDGRGVHLSGDDVTDDVMGGVNVTDDVMGGVITPDVTGAFAGSAGSAGPAGSGSARFREDDAALFARGGITYR
jgi:hypothetical protein